MGAACAVPAIVAVVFRDLGVVMGAGKGLVRRDKGLLLYRFRSRRCVRGLGLRGGGRCVALFLRRLGLLLRWVALG